MIQNQWRSGNCIGEKDLVMDHHLDQTGTFLIDKLCRLQGEVLLDHKDMVAIVLYQQEGPGTYIHGSGPSGYISIPNGPPPPQGHSGGRFISTRHGSAPD